LAWRENAKKAAAIAAVAHVEDGFVLGLGSGTTIVYALQELGRRQQEKKLSVFGVPTSYQAVQMAIKHKIPLTTLDEHPRLDMTIDGADQVDEKLNMIKGMGGAMTREKIVASASRLNVIVVDETKLTEKKLGHGQPVPVEVLPFAMSTVEAKLCELGGKPFLREAERKLGPVISDNGNFIFDVDFGSISDPKKTNHALKAIPGVIETGLFVEMADVVYVGRREGVRKLKRP
jgi:ribose 5-phosphate isomerase A